MSSTLLMTRIQRLRGQESARRIERPYRRRVSVVTAEKLKQIITQVPRGKESPEP